MSDRSGIFIMIATVAFSKSFFLSLLLRISFKKEKPTSLTIKATYSIDFIFRLIIVRLSISNTVKMLRAKQLANTLCIANAIRKKLGPIGIIKRISLLRRVHIMIALRIMFCPNSLMIPKFTNMTSLRIPKSL